ncbi:MAG: PspA/IM30 family protein [Defluviitaleaceae bacterium]|nr:PspA/IM30 family protein [Defluviitaleaceae bacterium]
MGILGRFKDIMSSNVNAMLDKMEDPSKMVDQMLINMNKDLAQVKVETANVMAEETRCKRLLDDNQEKVAEYVRYAEKAVMAGNDADAATFLAKKQEYESAGAGLQTAYEAARANAEKMRQMHDKLVGDIATLQSRKSMIKAKESVAKTQERVNKFSMPDTGRGGEEAFSRMEDKVNQRLDAANAMSDLNTAPVDAAKALEEKYKDNMTDASVQRELEAMKARLGKGPKAEGEN